MSRIRGVLGHELIPKISIHWLSKYEHEFLGWASCPTLPYVISPQTVLGMHVYVYMLGFKLIHVSNGAPIIRQKIHDNWLFGWPWLLVA